MDPVKIFGKWGPSVVKQHFNEAQIFRKGTNPDQYTAEEDDQNKFKNDDKRGSSEKWNDASEFITPFANREKPDGNTSA